MVFAPIPLTLALNIIGFGLAILRLQNIGVSGWWALLHCIPCVGPFVAIACLILPPGFATDRKPDTAMAIIVGLMIVIGMMVGIAILESH